MEWFPLLLALGVHKFNFRGEMPKIVDETAGIRNTAVEFFSGLVKWSLFRDIRGSLLMGFSSETSQNLKKFQFAVFFC